MCAGDWVDDFWETWNGKNVLFFWTLKAYVTLSGYHTLSFLLMLTSLLKGEKQSLQVVANIWIPIGEKWHNQCICCSNRGVTFALISPQTFLWPVEMFSFKLDFDRGSFGCCCVWKSGERWVRTSWASKWRLECIRVWTCVFLCSHSPQSVCKCVFIRVCLLPCVSQLTVT